MKLAATALFLVLLVFVSHVSAISGQSGATYNHAPQQDRQLARGIFKQLIETNTSHSVGSVTVASREMQQRFLAAGFPASDVLLLGPVDRKQNLVVRYRGTGLRKPILFICHLDVVEALRSDWNTDPFQLVEKDGYFYGRGTQDVKESAALLVADLIRLRRQDYRPDRDIILALTADEEEGGQNGVEWLLQHHRDLLDAEFVINVDAGRIDTEHGKPVIVGVAASEKTYADFLLTVKDPGGHSSLPRPDNAIYLLATALGRLQHSPFPFELNPVTRAYFSHLVPQVSPADATAIRSILQKPPEASGFNSLARTPLYNAQLRTTCVPTRLSAGHANNALPQTAEANVNCRILPGHSPEDVRQDLIRIFADSKVGVRYVNSAENILDTAPAREAYAPPPLRADVMQPLKRIVAEMWPGTPVVPEMETGASDSIYTMAAGIPTYGITGIAIDINDVRAHGKDERLPVASFYRGLDFYYLYIRALTGPQSTH